MYALNDSTGIPIWSYTTGNGVESSPAVANGVVYVGSWDHNVYAFGSFLTAPSVSASLGTMDQGQTSDLTISVATTGTSPYLYQWFNEAPGASSYSLITGANSASYNFVTSAFTDTGSWSVILQVIDSTGAAVNSTATTVTVNTPTPTPTATQVPTTSASPTPSPSPAQSATATIVAVSVVLVVVVVVAILVLLRKRQKLPPPPPPPPM